MKNPFKKVTVLDDEILRVRNKMLHCDIGTEEYNALMASFERLVLLSTHERGGRVSPDTAAIVCANLLGILIIVGYEQGHIAASRGLQFLLRTKHQ